MSSQFLPKPNPALIFKALPEGALIYSPGHEVYFSLNEAGARVWSLLPPVTTTLEELVDRLGGAYSDVSVSVLRADVEELLADFLKHELVVSSS